MRRDGANRLKKGLDAVASEEMTDDSETEGETSTVRSSSFDAVPPAGYVAAAPIGSGWLSALLPSSADSSDAASVDCPPPTTAPAAATASSTLIIFAQFCPATHLRRLMVLSAHSELYEIRWGAH